MFNFLAVDDFELVQDGAMGYPSVERGCCIFKRQLAVFLRHEHDTALQGTRAGSRFAVPEQKRTAIARAVSARQVWLRGSHWTFERWRCRRTRQGKPESGKYREQVLGAVQAAAGELAEGDGN